MNGIVDVRTNVPLKILLEKYFTAKRLITRIVNLTEVLGLRDHTYCDRYNWETQEVLTMFNQEESEIPQIINNWKQEDFGDHTSESTKDPLSELYMEHLTEDYPNRLLKVLRKYPGLYDRNLGEVVTT